MKSANNWPKGTTEELMAFYGPVGKNQTKLRVPYPLTLSWAPHVQVTRITCHQKVAESMDKVMNIILESYGRDEINRLRLDNWGGCLNVRKKRGGNNYSVHSWGAANDWYPEANQLWTPWHRASFSQPVYIDFFNAWIGEGWNPLGLSANFDAMHIEAVDNDVPYIPTHPMLRHIAA